MKCRITELNLPAMSMSKVANAIFLLWAVNYEDAELKEYYAEGLAFYMRITENQQAVNQQGQNNESTRHRKRFRITTNGDTFSPVHRPGRHRHEGEGMAGEVPPIERDISDVGTPARGDEGRKAVHDQPVLHPLFS